MPLSEDERSLLHTRKNNIELITEEIIDLTINCKKNKKEILDRMSRIFFNLKELCAISNNFVIEPELIKFRDEFLRIHEMFSQDERQKIIQYRIINFCADANSVTLKEK